jgi:hypothetical protein
MSVIKKLLLGVSTPVVLAVLFVFMMPHKEWFDHPAHQGMVGCFMLGVLVGWGCNWVIKFVQR